MKKAAAIIILLFFLIGCGTPSVPVTSPTETVKTEIIKTTAEVVIQEESASNEKIKVDAPEIKPDNKPASGQLKVHFIDVGQGDSIFIKLPSGGNMLIDGGPRSAGQKVVSYLKQAGVTSIDLVISTHPHEDHIGGLISVLDQFPVGEVIDPAVVHTTKTFEKYLTLVDIKDIKFTEGRAGMERDLGNGAKIFLLHPVNPSSSHLNDASIVAKLTFGHISFLFTGDAEQASEMQILTQSRVIPESTILKVGHHGSNTGTTQAFLDVVNPEVAVIQCGVNNHYGHPHEEVLQRLAVAGIDIYRTDQHGDIVFTSDGQTYDVNVKQPYQLTPQKVPEEPAPQPSVTEGKFVGSIKSDKYHFPKCRHAESIKPENDIWFNSIQDAKSKGYAPCGVCKPPQ